MRYNSQGYVGSLNMEYSTDLIKFQIIFLYVASQLNSFRGYENDLLLESLIVDFMFIVRLE